MALSRKFATPVAMGAMLASLTLSGCSAASPAVSPTKSAGIVTKDLAVCISNGTDANITVKWDEAKGISTFDSTGMLLSGGKYCAEGPLPDVSVTFADEVTTRISSHNPVAAYPYVGFSDRVYRMHDNDHQWDSIWSYAQGEQLTNDVKGHQILVIRDADTSWIKFEIIVLT